MVLNIKKDDYRNIAFCQLMKGVSNRRIIQHLQLKLKKIDIQPLNIKEFEFDYTTKRMFENIVFNEIKVICSEIRELLEENHVNYTTYFSNTNPSSFFYVRDLLLDNEEHFFALDIIYQEVLEKATKNQELLRANKYQYWQKIYDIIVDDLIYE